MLKQDNPGFLAEEIAKVLGTKMEDIKGTGLNREFIYEIARLEGKSLISGDLFFKNDNKFVFYY